MLNEIAAMHDTYQEAGINSLFRPEDKKFGCANTILFREDCLIEIWPELSVKHITLSESEFRALNISSDTPADADEPAGADMLQTDVERFGLMAWINLNADQISKICQRHGLRAHAYATALSLDNAD